MKLLVLGADGQVGWELCRVLDPIGEIVACTRKDADLEDSDRLVGFLEALGPDIVVNAAAYTAVDQAEQEPDRARIVNAQSVGVLAQWAASAGALLVHYSTDYVFDGTKHGAYTETDTPNPISVYGQTKLEGERAIIESGCRHLIFRTSWVYSSRGSNFLKTIARLASEREKLDIVSDQVGAPTSAAMIAGMTALAITSVGTCKEGERALLGLYHLTASGQTSWHGLAEYFFSNSPAMRKTVRINPISSDRFPTAAARPLNSVLDTSKFSGSFGSTPPHWQHHVDRLIATMYPQEIT